MSKAKVCDLCGKIIRRDENALQLRVEYKSLFATQWEAMDFHRTCWDKLRREMGWYESEID